jgi:hypothetical protein
VARHDFKKPVVKLLSSRVAGRCSNPDCRVQTVGPSSNGKTNTIGVAAHITAASVGGPRYDESLTLEQRIAIENGIWLCANCAGRIDRDEELYTVNLLNEWKVAAEQLAHEEQGVKIPDQKFIDSTIKTAFTGMPMDFHPQAISNIHNASVNALQALDPRFSIESTYINGLTTYSFEAKENVSLSMHIESKEPEHYGLAFQKFVEEGKDFTISSNSVLIDGSDLLKKLFAQNGGELSLVSPKVNVLQKIWLLNAETSEVVTFDDVTGKISLGTKALTFEGHACEGVLRFSFQIYNPELNMESKFSLTINYEKWENLEINTLPYFDKVHSLFTRMSEGWKFFTSLERQGELIVQSVGQDLSEHEFVYLTRNFLDYTSYCRTIASKMKMDITYSGSVSFTKKEILKLKDAADILLGNGNLNKDQVITNLTCKLTVDDSDNHLIILKNSDKPAAIQTVQDVPEVVKLFGKEVTLPIMKMTFLNILPKYNADLTKVQPGDIIDVEWVPQDYFSCIYEYVVE